MKQYSGINFSELDLSRIVDFISKQSDTEIKSILDFTSNTFHSLVEKNHLEKKFYLLHQSFHKFKEILEYHIRKEELILFPVLKNVNGKTTFSSNSQNALPDLSKPIDIIKKDQERILCLLTTLKNHTVYFTDTKDENLRLCLQSLEHLDTCIRDNINFHNSVLFPKIINLQKAQNNIIN